MSVRLNPSESGRWIHCPGSIRQIAAMPPEEEPPRTPEARRGDGCHTLLERSVVEEQPPAAFTGRCIILDGPSYRDLPMAERVFVPEPIDVASVDHAYQHVRAAREAGAAVEVESFVDIGAELQRFDVEALAWVPIGVTSRGRIDLTIRRPGELELIDYKSGKRHVSEVGNTQLLLYTIGCGPLPPDVEIVKLTIVQPNSIRTDVPVLRTWEIPASEVASHRQRITDAAARCLDPDAPLVPGEHCQDTHCPARATCPALASKAVTVLTSKEQPDALTASAGEPGGLDGPPIRTPVAVDGLAMALAKEPEVLTLDQLADILEAEDMIRGWLAACRKRAYGLAMSGNVRIPRHKLGKGSGSYKWKLPAEELRKKMQTFGRIGENGKSKGRLKIADFTTETIVSPNQAKSRVKPLVTAKTWESIAALIERTEGAPVLVHESDTREEYTVQTTAEALGITEEGGSPGGDVPDFLK